MKEEVQLIVNKIKLKTFISILDNNETMLQSFREIFRIVNLAKRHVFKNDRCKNKRWDFS